MEQLRRKTTIFLMLVSLVMGWPHLSFGQSDGSYHTRLSEGIARLNQNDLGVALRHFTAALDEDPNGVEAHYYLGVTHARAMRNAKAETHFLKALSVDRTFIPAQFDLGVLYFQIRKDEPAMKAFKVVEAIDPGRARVHYYQGLILRRNGKAREADAKLKKAVKLDPDLGVVVSFQSGVAQYEAGALDSAKSEFQQALDLAPKGEYAGPALDFIKKIESESGDDKKPWRIITSFGFQYDDNVVLDPGGVSLPPGITQKDDVLGVFYLKGRYEWLKRNLWRGALEYRFFQNLHTEGGLDDLNIQDHQLILSGRRQVGQHELSLAYEFQYVTLGGDGYMIRHEIGPRFAMKHQENRFSEFIYAYGNKDFDDIQPLFSGNSDRDVDAHRLAVNHIVLFGEKGHYFAGYQYEMEDAGSNPAEDDWGYHGHRINFGFTLPPWKTLIFSFEGELVRRDYKDPNESAVPKVKREDDDVLFIGMVSKPLTEMMTLSGQYLFQNNSSNVPVYDYQRNIVGLIVTASF
ncbi:MAG: tetratricopeptide repeat protein [Nitrospiria bacterium]